MNSHAVHQGVIAAGNIYHIIIALIYMVWYPFWFSNLNQVNEVVGNWAQNPLIYVDFFPNPLKANQTVCPQYGMEGLNYTLRTTLFQNVTGQPPNMTFYNWQTVNGLNYELCLQRDRSYNYLQGINWNFSNANANQWFCQIGYKQCFNGVICVPVNSTCPIQNMQVLVQPQINNSLLWVNTSYSVNSNRMPLVELKISAFPPCLINQLDFATQQDQGYYQNQYETWQGQCNGNWFAPYANVSNLAFWSANGFTNDPPNTLVQAFNSSGYTYNLYARPWYQVNPSCNQVTWVVSAMFWYNYLVGIAILLNLVTTFVSIIPEVIRGLHAQHAFSGYPDNSIGFVKSVGKPITFVSFLIRSFLYCVHMSIYACYIYIQPIWANWQGQNCSGVVDLRVIMTTSYNMIQGAMNTTYVMFAFSTLFYIITVIYLLAHLMKKKGTVAPVNTKQ